MCFESTNQYKLVDGCPSTCFSGNLNFPKEDISYTTAELVYGTTLCLPGEYFTPTTTESLLDPSNYVRQLKALMQHIHSSPPWQLANNDSNIPKGLATATHVFIHQDVVRKPLQPPYDGPFLAVKRMDKHYTIDINGRKDTVSIDQLKPAHLDDNPPPTTHESTTQPPTCTTRSGRHIHFPNHFTSFVS